MEIVPENQVPTPLSQGSWCKNMLLCYEKWFEEKYVWTSSMNWIYICDIMSQDYGTVILGASVMRKITNFRFFTLLVILLEDARKKKELSFLIRKFCLIKSIWVDEVRILLCIKCGWKLLWRWYKNVTWHLENVDLFWSCSLNVV